MSADVSERFSAIQSEVYHHGYDRGYRQGKADAIDECIEALGNNIWDIAKLEQLKVRSYEQN